MPQQYTKTAMALHWLIALLIIAAFFLGLTMTDIPGITPTKLKYYSWHKWMGCTVFGLACLRLLWRLFHTAPPYPASMGKLQQHAANVMHVLLYILIFAVPLSGYFYSLAAGIPVVYLGLVKMPVLIDPNPELKPLLKSIHYTLNMLMAAGVVMHVLAALKHQFIDRDRIFKRMLP
jgi:cytochrome b561